MANAFDRFLINMGGGNAPAKGEQMTDRQRQMRNMALMNAAQTILAQPNYDDQSDGQQFINLTTAGLGSFSKSYQDQLAAGRQNELAEMEYKVKKMQYQRALDLEEARKNAPTLTGIVQKRQEEGESYKGMGDSVVELARQKADYYRRMGFDEEAAKYTKQIPFYDRTERVKYITGEKAKHRASKNKLIEAQRNIGTIEALLKQGSGQADLAALTTTIKSIDNSVVRQEEANAFNAAAGALNAAISAAKRLDDGTYAPETIANIYRLAADAYKIAEDSYFMMAEQEIASYDDLLGMDVGQQIVLMPERSTYGTLTTQEIMQARADNKAKRRNPVNSSVWSRR